MELLNVFALLNMGGPELLLIVVFFLPTIIAVVDIAMNKFEGNQQIFWLLIAIFVPFGAYIYFIVGRKQRIRVS
jgi:Phospholipase_D-nuclease N-terminal